MIGVADSLLSSLPQNLFQGYFTFKERTLRKITTVEIEQVESVVDNHAVASSFT